MASTGALVEILTRSYHRPRLYLGVRASLRVWCLLFAVDELLHAIVQSQCRLFLELQVATKKLSDRLLLHELLHVDLRQFLRRDTRVYSLDL